MLDLVKQLHERYGLHAFGLVAVLLLWAVMFKPLLQSQTETTRSVTQAAASFEVSTANMRELTRELVDALDKLNPAQAAAVRRSLAERGGGVLP